MLSVYLLVILKSDSLNPTLNEISVLIKYANQISSYFWSVGISIFGHLFRPFCFGKYTQNAIKTYFEGLQGTYQEKCQHTHRKCQSYLLLLNKQRITLCKKKKSTQFFANPQLMCFVNLKNKIKIKTFVHGIFNLLNFFLTFFKIFLSHGSS